jgi:pimeloyl-ACP methyl ester carboxylesterase
MLSITRKAFALAALSALIACVSTPEARETTPEATLFTPTRFSVEISGQGPDVILIPGLASSRDVWDATVDQLDDRYRVHAIQVAGFAGEPAGGNAEGPVVQPLMEELARYIQHNHIERPAVIGHSLGGFTALMLARAHPESVGRVMSVDSLPFFSVLIDPNATAASIAPAAAASRDQMLGMSDEQFAAVQNATMARLVRTESARAPVVQWSLSSDRSVVARAMYDVMTTDLRPDLASIHTPVTIVYAYDPAMMPEAAVTGLYASQYAALPNKRLIKVDNAFHFLQLDNPAAFAAVVEEFLR